MWLSDFLIQISDMMYFFIMNKTNCCCTLNRHFEVEWKKWQFLSSSEVKFSLFLLTLFCIFPHYPITFQFMTYRECEKNFPTFTCLANEPPWDVEIYLFSCLFAFVSCTSLFCILYVCFTFILISKPYLSHVKCTDISSINQSFSPVSFCFVELDLAVANGRQCILRTTLNQSDPFIPLQNINLLTVFM